MNTREIRGWVIKQHEVGVVEVICNIAWEHGHSVARNTRNQQGSGRESHEKEVKAGISPPSNQNPCDSDIPAIPVKPEAQTIKCEPPG